MKYFETRFLDEADKFIAKLDVKTARKILYNIDIAEQTNDPKLFKKLQNDIWNSELDLEDFKLDYWHFGTEQMKKKH